MANPLLVPVAGILAGLYLLTRGDEASAAVANQPVFTPGAQDLFTEMRPIPGGGQARYFKAEFVQMIMGLLSQKSLQPIQVQGQAQGLLFKCVPLAPPGLSAQSACQAANTQNMVVFASMSMTLPNDPAEKLVLFASPSQRTLAGPDSKFAILLDAGGASSVVAPGTGLPSSASPFDPNMPPAVAKEVNAMLADPNADPEMLEKSADDLEAAGFPIAAQTLRDRAKTIRLQRALQDKNAGGTPFTIRGNASGLAVDLPSHTAQHYTGDGTRWREIASVNSKLGMVVTGSGNNANLKPWKAGLTILLPLSWDARSKPLPKPLGVPAKSKEPKGVVTVGPLEINPEEPVAFGPPTEDEMNQQSSLNGIPPSGGA